MFCTERLPRIIGSSRAMDMILTGRAVSAKEAYEWGLANRVCGKGKSKIEALKLALLISSFPQSTMRSDRISMLRNLSESVESGLKNEFIFSKDAVKEGSLGAAKFIQGEGRGGTWEGKSKL